MGKPWNLRQDFRPPPAQGTRLKQRLPSGAPLAERERIGLNTGIQKLDLEMSIRDAARLPDQLIQARSGGAAVALGVNVNPVRRARRLAVDADTKSHRGSRCRRTHHDVQVAGVKAIG